MATLPEITVNWASGASAADLKPNVKKFLGTLDDEALVEVFKVLPRQLSMPHFDVFRKAEQARKTNEVSSLLLATDFENCGPVDTLGDIVAYAVANVSDDVLAPHAQAVFGWRLRLLKLAPKGISLDAPAKGALIYAINAPSFLNFEELHDAVKSAKVADKDALALAEFVDTVLLAGAGTAGHAAFVAKRKGFFEGLGVTQALRKAQLLSLCAVMAGKQSMTLDELAKSLGVGSSEEAENLVVDAALANIIDVEVDRSQGNVSIKSVMPLRYDAPAMKQLLAAIDSNIKFVDGLTAAYAA
uniref:PCI domain-containing protein n=1 Tax=Neobodo designis TaxID=312471 RepID=A0A7S1Q5G2_NEODS|eukprot:CAMPEP_0174851724 /NCGR_PEP_ID=MMETSP1114-20130205/23595_1 /TAXON_ID=312471 /ORGANISM="Neobodo designis, Strain CCAP 1951/1" /LENGTH=299 /DNA_ID=CAMNT_0016086279 /DNA_START=30 /DNA_END=929 /DNA_ORIENTATION=+